MVGYQLSLQPSSPLVAVRSMPGHHDAGERPGISFEGARELTVLTE